MSTLEIVFLTILGFIVVFILPVAMMGWLVFRTPVDRTEDRDQSDRDVRQIVESTRGTL